MILALFLIVGCQDETEVLPNPNADVTPMLTNGGFEDGNFNWWLLKDMAMPYLGPPVVQSGIVSTGTWAVRTGYDGGGPDTATFSQDVAIPIFATSLLLDYNAVSVDVTLGATLDRTFDLHIEPVGGGAPLQSINIHTAPWGVITDSGGWVLDHAVDVSAFAGESVRIVLAVFVPEYFTGPGDLYFDTIRIQ